MRDDLPQMPMTAQAKRYTRRSGLAAMQPGVGQKAYVKMTADLVNGGRTAGFKSKDVGASTTGRKNNETARTLVQALINRRVHG